MRTPRPDTAASPSCLPPFQALRKRPSPHTYMSVSPSSRCCDRWPPGVRRTRAGGGRDARVGCTQSSPWAVGERPPCPRGTQGPAWGGPLLQSLSPHPSPKSPRGGPESGLSTTGHSVQTPLPAERGAGWGLAPSHSALSGPPESGHSPPAPGRRAPRALPTTPHMKLHSRVIRFSGPHEARPGSYFSRPFGFHPGDSCPPRGDAHKTIALPAQREIQSTHSADAPSRDANGTGLPGSLSEAGTSEPRTGQGPRLPRQGGAERKPEVAAFPRVPHGPEITVGAQQLTAGTAGAAEGSPTYGNFSCRSPAPSAHPALGSSRGFQPACHPVSPPREGTERHTHVGALPPSHTPSALFPPDGAVAWSTALVAQGPATRGRSGRC